MGVLKKLREPWSLQQDLPGVRCQVTHIPFFDRVIALVDDRYETSIHPDVHKAYNKSIMPHYPHEHVDRIDDVSTQWILHWLTRYTQNLTSSNSKKQL